MNVLSIKIDRIIYLLFLICLNCNIVCSQSNTATPYKITDKFTASGYMGDKVKFIKNSTEDPLSGETCIKVSYTANNELWGGLFWQKPANNWCNKPGINLSAIGYTKLTFWAKGKDGREEIKFMVGHDCGDSISKEKLLILENSWNQYSIDIKEEDLSNITGAFGFAIDSKAQSGPITFFLDDVQFE